jgi:hypothetical protein
MDIGDPMIFQGTICDNRAAIVTRVHQEAIVTGYAGRV